MRFWLLPSRMSCVLLCPSLLLLLLLRCILLLLVDLSLVLWDPSRHLGSLTTANWVSFDFNVSYSSCWGYSLINTLKLKNRSQFRTLFLPHRFIKIRHSHQQTISIEFLTICRIPEFPKSEQNRKSCENVRIWRKRAAVCPKNRSNLKKSFGMNVSQA